MGRTVDQEVHAAFVEFRAKEDDKCLSVQCIYCQQIRAKNTSRQKQHLLECPALRGQHNPHAQPPPTNGVTAPNGYGAPPNGPPGAPGAGAMQAPMQTIPGRPSLPSQAPTAASSSTAPPQARAHSTPKAQKARQSTSNLPAPPLDDVHAAFVEFRAKEEDKCLSVQCIYCQQVRAKNTSRQRQHLLECPTLLECDEGLNPCETTCSTPSPKDDIRAFSSATRLPAFEA
ncbi:hypothetical protein CIHG_06315 [Coccidioides immitis H538.4]|uniref:Uncharacterized protein n=1 Tax=Coccidioides immitis H538.4 TaxID=396776 RepID=A0A0J8RTH6_COCIT|nr:hypothetical protein CIHG_06315 [Coccidioides immitis H538.4]